DSFRPRQEVVEHLQALRLQHRRRIRDAGRIAPGPAETCDEAELYWVAAAREYDGDRRRYRLHGETRRVAARGDNNRDVAVQEVLGQRGQLVWLAFAPTIFDNDVLALNESALLQALAECGQGGGRHVGCSAVEKADDRRLRLLRERRSGYQ